MDEESADNLDVKWYRYKSRGFEALWVSCTRQHKIREEGKSTVVCKTCISIDGSYETLTRTHKASRQDICDSGCVFLQSLVWLDDSVSFAHNLCSSNYWTLLARE